jgi:hypothetical protein
MTLNTNNNIGTVIVVCRVSRFCKIMVAPAVAGKAVRCDGEDIIKVYLCAWNRAFRVCVCVCVCLRASEFKYT